VAEIMLTLETAVDNVDVNVCPLIRDAFMSTPNLAKDPATPSSSPVILPPATSSSAVVSSVRMSGGCRGNAILSSASSSPYTHIRSTSYNLAALSRKAIVSSPPILENKGMYYQLVCDCILFQISLSVLLATCHQCALILPETSALYKLFTYLLTYLR